MNEAQQQLARRLVEHPAWRWMPGMLVMSDPEKVPRVLGSAVVQSSLRARVMSVALGIWWGVGEFCVECPDFEHETASGDDLPGSLPDLTDPATVGCLLALAREAWGDPYAACEHRHVTPRMSGWTVRVEQQCDALGVRVSGRSPLEMLEPTEGDAIAHAILAAPTKETTT